MQAPALNKLTLAQLKEIAATEGLDPSWTRVGREHIAELRKILVGRYRQVDRFAKSVRDACEVTLHPACAAAPSCPAI
jgi:hypothetical protein